MASGKWITEVTPETASIDAARRVLGLRLAALRDAMGDVLQGRDADCEEVHQLRVAARRASSAVDVFQPCLAKKAYLSASKRLRRLRRAAGDARDLDVFLMDYTRRLEETARDQAAALDLLCGYAIAERIPAQARLSDACAGYPFEFERWMSETIAALVGPPREVGRMQDLGRAYLGGLCERIRRAIDASAPSYEELHSLRVVAKRFRYAMEIFADCFAAPFREELYPRVAELQEILGTVNDAHVGLARTEGLLRGLSTLLPLRCARWHEFLEGFAEDLTRRRMQGCEQLEAWKARVNRTGFDALFHTVLTGASADGPSRSYSVAQAS
jgi:CHAD domain-containing protein